MELTNDVISPVSGQYIIVCDHECEATEDDTRLVCVQAPVAYSSQILLLDIPAGETRTVAKHKDISYLFFSENCSISGTSIKQYDVKRLTSESVDIKNESEDICRAWRLKHVLIGDLLETVLANFPLATQHFH